VERCASKLWFRETRSCSRLRAPHRQPGPFPVRRPNLRRDKTECLGLASGLDVRIGVRMPASSSGESRAELARAGKPCSIEVVHRGHLRWERLRHSSRQCDVETAVRDDGGEGLLGPVANERSVANSAHAIAVAIYPDGSFGEFDANSVKKAPNGPVPGFGRRRAKQRSHVGIFHQ
jgi:hypothetical protein